MGTKDDRGISCVYNLKHLDPLGDPIVSIAVHNKYPHNLHFNNLGVLTFLLNGVAEL